MQVVFNGVTINASFFFFYENNDLVQSLVVQPAQDKADALKFTKLTEENFMNALKALKETRVKIEEDVAKQVAEASKKV